MAKIINISIEEPDEESKIAIKILKEYGYECRGFDCCSNCHKCDCGTSGPRCKHPRSGCPHYDNRLAKKQDKKARESIFSKTFKRRMV